MCTSKQDIFTACCFGPASHRPRVYALETLKQHRVNFSYMLVLFMTRENKNIISAL